jgi:enoyl-CoA hydratase/carnithine racemase
VRYELVSLTASGDGAVRELRLSGAPLSAREALERAAAADELVGDRDVRAVVLGSAGPDFCVGGADGFDPLAAGVDPAAALARLRVPVVVVVRGRCRSVGLELALVGDIVVAGNDATFSLPDVVEAGRLPCWGGTQRLPRAVGAARATAMLLLGEELDATRAGAAGFVWQLADNPDDAARGIAAQLATLGPLALEYAKEVVHRGAELPLRDGLRLEGDLNTLLAASADRAEGLAAFFAKRPADFAGR